MGQDGQFPTRPGVWTSSRHSPCPGETPASSHASSDLKIAPCVKRALDNAAQASCGGVVRGADGGPTVKTGKHDGDRTVVTKFHIN